MEHEEKNIPRGVSDPNLKWINTLKQETTPLLIDADAGWKIDSTTQFASEQMLRPIFFGAKQGFKATKFAERASAIVKLDFTPEPLPANGDKKDLVEPLAKTKERQRLWLEGVKNAQTLIQRGVPVAFTTAGCKSQAVFFENLQRVVKEGLSRTAALAGLTQTPAAILGISKQLGSITAGKTANLTILTADFLDPKTKVKYLIIDGQKIDPAREPFKFDNGAQGGSKESGR